MGAILQRQHTIGPGATELHAIEKEEQRGLVTGHTEGQPAFRGVARCETQIESWRGWLGAEKAVDDPVITTQRKVIVVEPERLVTDVMGRDIDRHVLASLTGFFVRGRGAENGGDGIRPDEDVANLKLDRSRDHRV